MGARASSPIRLVRGLLLLAFVGTLLAIVGLLWFGSMGRTGAGAAAPASAAAPARGADPQADITIEGESFRQAVTQGEQVLFEVQGGRYRADRQDNVFLEDVVVIVAREDGEWQLRGDAGRFNRQSKEARLEGEVTMAGPNGLSVAARWLDLRQGGKVLVASRGTRFTLRDSLEGESEHLRMDLERQVTVLSDGVVVRGLGGGARPSFDLACERVVFDRATHRVDAEGEVRLRSADGALDAKRVSIQLDTSDRQVVGMRALWDVAGWLRRSDAAPTGGAIERVSFAGTTLALDLDAAERPVRLHLEGSVTKQATLRTAESGGIDHRVRAVEVLGAFTEGRLSSLLARRPVELEERRDGELVRVGRARRALAAFDEQGRMVRVDLEERVALNGDGLTASGERASMLLLERSVTLWGDPVEVQRGEDRLSAPEVIHRAATGVLEARGGVRATLTASEGELLGAAALGEGDGPVLIEAADAAFREAENEVLFRGGVRAWRGTSLLLADQLRGDRTGESLAASGSVRTVWRPPAGAEGERDEPTDSASTGSVGPRQPVEIAARLLTYRSTEKNLRYEGDVSVVQGEQTVTCQDLRVELDDDQQPQRYDCSGDARVVDQGLQRTVEGSRVVYLPGGGEVEVSGEPVRLVDPKLGRIEGQRLWYSIDDESVRMGPAPAVEGGGAEGETQR